MNYQTTWTMSVTDKITGTLTLINEKGQKMATTVGNSLDVINGKMETATAKTTKFGDCLKKIKPIDWQALTTIR